MFFLKTSASDPNSLYPGCQALYPGQVNYFLLKKIFFFHSKLKSFLQILKGRTTKVSYHISRIVYTSNVANKATYIILSAQKEVSSKY